MQTVRCSLDDWIAGAQYFEHEGQRIAYWSAGNGRALLLVHGFPTSSWDWHLVWDAMAEGRRVIACDMLGFGLSDKPTSGYSIHTQADIQLALLDHLGVSKFDVLAHDYGVSVGQEMLARCNEQGSAFGLGRILFLNGGLFPEQHRMLPIQKLGIGPLGFLVSLLMNRKRFGENFSRVFGSDTKPSKDELDDFWHLICLQDGHRISHKLLHYILDRRQHRERWVGALLEANIPVKLVNGGADPVSGKHMYEYFREIVPKTEAVCLEAIGHYPQTEAPDRVLAEAMAFFDPA
jgi:pimeloyl-ACP methyl ester carboxylesterase